MHRLKALIILQVCVYVGPPYLRVGSGASVVISGHEAEACLLVKLAKRKIRKHIFIHTSQTNGGWLFFSCMDNVCVSVCVNV